MSKYKRYLQDGDEAITKRTKYRYGINHDASNYLEQVG